MKITLYRDTQIGRKVHKAGTMIDVVPEVGKELCMKGAAACVDQSYNIVALKYVPQPKKKITPKKVKENGS